MNREPRKRKKQKIKIVVLLTIVPFVVCSCSFGTRTVRRSRLGYNRALRLSEDQQLLLNLVRLKYHEPVKFLSVAAISTQFNYEGSLGVNSNTLVSKASKLGVRTGVDYAERPTITYSPLEGQEFTQRLLAPIKLETIQFLSGSGWSMYRVLLLTAQMINGIDNASGASGPTPLEAPEYKKFKRAACLLRKLQKEGRIELVSEEQFVPISVDVSLKSLNAGDLLQASKNGYTYRPGKDGDFVLGKIQADPVLRLSSDSLHCRKTREVVKLLNLKRRRLSYQLKLASEGQLRMMDHTAPRESLLITTRSLLSTMFYLSHAIAVPPAHVRAGLVTRTLRKDRSPFDWRDVTGDILRIRSSPKRPDQAKLAVPYRNHWYYIADDDLQSKITFSLLVELFALEITAGGASQLPVLTLSVGS